MKRILSPLAILAALVFTSCATSKFYSQDAATVRPLALVQPCSYLTDADGDLVDSAFSLYLCTASMQ